MRRSPAREIELPDKLIHARAHEMLEETFRALARQGVSREGYLQITGMDEEQLAHEAEPKAAQGLRREAVIAAVVEAEQIEPTEGEVLEALEPSATEGNTTPEKLLEQLRSSGGLERLRADLASRQAVELLVREAKPITVEQAKARDKLWTPEKDDATGRPGQLWTPAAEQIGRGRTAATTPALQSGGLRLLHSAGIRLTKEKKRGP